MIKEFTREVHCSDQYDSLHPEVMVVEVGGALAKRIKMLAAEVKRLEVYATEESNYAARWYYRDWNREWSQEDPEKLVVGDEFEERLDFEVLRVSGDYFWWEGYLHGSSVHVVGDQIAVSELD